MTRVNTLRLVACMGLTTFMISAAGATSACSIGDIKVKQADLVRQSPSGLLIVVGELVNGCADATGVRFHITLRDSAGKVVSADDPWPAGTDNIPPHSSYAFTLNADEPRPDRPAVSLQVDVAEVHKW